MKQKGVTDFAYSFWNPTKITSYERISGHHEQMHASSSHPQNVLPRRRNITLYKLLSSHARSKPGFELQ